MSFNPSTYFATLCSLHTSAPELVREYSSSRIFINNTDLIGKLQTSQAQYFCILQANRDGDISGSTRDHERRYLNYALFMLKRVDRNDFDAIDTARQECDAIIADFASYMETDRENKVIPYTIETAYRALAVGPIADNLFGMVAFFTYSEPKQAKREVWNS
jgi:hypothetical protein